MGISDMMRRPIGNLLSRKKRETERKARESRRRMLWGTLCDELAAEFGFTPKEVEALLNAGPSIKQARKLLAAGQEFNVYPLALWRLHQALTRQGNGS